MAVPTSGEIRQARAGHAQVWDRYSRAIEGPLCAWLGATGTAMDVLAGPMSPVLSRAGLRPVGDLAETVAPVPDPRFNGTPVAVLNPLLGAAAIEDSSADRPPAPLRPGLYGELAWRGWQMLHQMRTHRSMAALQSYASDIAQGVNSAVEQCADELHDRSEEVMGRFIIGARHLRRQLTAAVLVGAYTQRSLTAPDEHD
ncbi:MAG TPA: hypothetical protein VFE65_32505 [Pseudonocardia sp.]|nr:hypothetical protein [Pseudonocardia sp.]